MLKMMIFLQAQTKKQVQTFLCSLNIFMWAIGVTIALFVLA